MYRIILASLFFLFSVSTLFAQSAAKLEISGLSGNCNTTSISGSYTITAYDANGSAINGAVNVTRIYSVNGKGSPFVDTITSGEVFSFVIDSLQDVTESTLEVWLTDDPSIRASVYVLDCANNQWGAVFAGDGRINYNLGDLYAALYVGRDESGAMALDVYSIQADSEGVFVGQFEGKDFAVKSADTNLEIDTLGSVTLYSLTSGEYQVNISGGDKVYSVIFSWPPRRTYGYNIEP